MSKVKTEIGRLLGEIETFLAETGMRASYMGHFVCNDGKLVERLRAGRTVTIDTAAAIRAFIADQGVKDEIESFLEEHGLTEEEFGRGFARDVGYVARLRQQAAIDPKSVVRLRAWMRRQKKALAEAA